VDIERLEENVEKRERFKKKERVDLKTER